MARTFSNDEAQALIDRTSVLLSQLRDAASSLGEFDNALEHTLRTSRQRLCNRILSDIPVERVDANNYRALDASYAGKKLTLANVVENPRASVASIADESGMRVPVESCLSHAYEGSRLTIDCASKTTEATSAVIAAYKRVHAAPFTAECEKLSSEMQSITAPLLSSLNVGTGTIKWLFSSRDRKDEAEAAFSQLNKLIGGDHGAKARGLISGLASVQVASGDVAWDWFSKHSEEAIALMEKASPGSLGRCDWPFLSSDAEALIRQSSHLRDQLEELASLPPMVEDNVKLAVDRCLASELFDTLKSISVDELNREKRGIRIKALKEAGYLTVADVYAATSYALESERGISTAGAMDAKRAAAEIAQETQKGLKLRLSVDNKTPATTQVVMSVYALKNWKPISEESKSLGAAVDTEIEAAKYGLLAARRCLQWLFASEGARSHASEAFNRLKAFIEGETGQKAEVLARKARFLKSGSYFEEEAWNDFAVNPVAYFNALEEVAPDVLGNDDALFGLPEELAREIQDECFFPDGLLCTLRRYQEWGVKYILHQEKTLLGDEMGLGKTVQAIAAMVSLKNTGETHFVVVCPASVLENWCREIRKHSRLRVARVHGRSAASAFAGWIKTGGVAVTTYETTAKLVVTDGFAYGLAVVDEAHYIKNPEAARSKNTLRLLNSARRSVLMTGTALENKVDEMLTLIGYLRPEIAQRSQSLAFMSGAQRFRDEVAPVYYRRKREDVLSELPELIESEEWCSLDTEEKEAYERAVLSKNFMAARRVSWNVADLKDSSKARRLLELVSDSRDDGRKVLIFTFFLDTAESIAQLLGKSCVGVIKGSVPPVKRQELVENFDAAAPGSVLIAQIQSGGTGMNIQSASVVVFCEPQYKPSIENQAISRAYRMGQARNVLAYRLLCKDTVDEKMLDLLKKKQAVFDAFADKSSAAAAAAESDIAVDDRSMGKIIEEEIERIKAENPELAARVEEERAEAKSHEEVARERNEPQAEPKSDAADWALGHETEVSKPGVKLPRISEKRVSFCIKCGERIPPEARFCPYCGEKVVA